MNLYFCRLSAKPLHEPCATEGGGAVIPGGRMEIHAIPPSPQRRGKDGACGGLKWLLFGRRVLILMAGRQIPLVEKNQGIGGVERIPTRRLLARGAQGNVDTPVFCQDNDGQFVE